MEIESLGRGHRSGFDSSECPPGEDDVPGLVRSRKAKASLSIDSQTFIKEQFESGARRPDDFAPPQLLLQVDLLIASQHITAGPVGRE
jgi:hypothetical protein